MNIVDRIDEFLGKKKKKKGEEYTDGSMWPLFKPWTFDMDTMGYNINQQAVLATYEKGKGSADYITFDGNPKYMKFEGKINGKEIKGYFKNMKDVEKLLKKYK